MIRNDISIFTDFKNKLQITPRKPLGVLGDEKDLYSHLIHQILKTRR